MPSAAILGTGLIGSSLGIALRGVGWKVRGWDPDGAALAAAERLGAVDAASGSREEACDGADLIALCGPVAAITDTLADLDTDALVTDVGGVKRPVVEAAAHLPRFVGGHPMAGRETSGPDGASGSLFRGATWVLCEDGATVDSLDALRETVESLGAVPVVMSAEAHDTAVALASHLPHLSAVALVSTVAAEPDALRLTAGGFRDLTRVAMSDPGWWVDVLRANRGPVAEAVRRLRDELTQLADALDRDDAEGLSARLSGSRRTRLGMAAPAATVGVVVEDRPGEIARVGHALAESGVDLRDLQLRHATHGGGGVLTLSVRAGEADRLREALRSDGFRLVDAR